MIQKGMIGLKNIVIIICVIFIIALGILLGFKIYNNAILDSRSGNALANVLDSNIIQENTEISTLETLVEEEKTTPNTLMIYKIYYTKCKHYIQEYEDIDASLVNCTESELQERCRDWKIDQFSKEEVELSKEEEKFCNQHYKLKLENNVIVVYSVDEEGRETEYEQTGITTEYLTQEDILKLTTGIYIYGKENLTSTIEDYE